MSAVYTDLGQVSLTFITSSLRDVAIVLDVAGRRQEVRLTPQQFVELMSGRLPTDVPVKILERNP